MINCAPIASIESWTQFGLTVLAIFAAIGTLLYKFLDVFKQVLAQLHQYGFLAGQASAKADAAQVANNNTAADVRSINEQLTAVAQQVPPPAVTPTPSPTPTPPTAPPVATPAAEPLRVQT